MLTPIRLIGPVLFFLISAGLFGSVTAWLNARDDRLKAEIAVEALSNTLAEQVSRYERTDKLLADTIRARDLATRRANSLARELAEVDSICVNWRLTSDVVNRLREYRGDPQPDGNLSAGPDDSLRAAPAAGTGITVAEYISGAEAFFEKCNSDRAKLREWSEQTRRNGAN